MYSIKKSIKTAADAKQVWNLWIDVESWATWDPGVLNCKLDGEFKAGSKGVLKPAKGPKVKFEIVDAIPNKFFQNRSYLPFAKMDFKHFIENIEGETSITHEIEFSGPLAFLFFKLIGSQIKKDLPIVIKNLAEKAESH